MAELGTLNTAMPTRSRAWWVLSLAVTVVLACEPKPGSVEPSSKPDAESTCAAARRLDELWTPERRARIAAQLDELPGDWPRQLLASLDARMPELSRRWNEARPQLCADTVTGDERCLYARAWAIDAALTLIDEAPERAASLWSVLDRASLDPSSCVGIEPAFELARGPALDIVEQLLVLGELEQAEQRLAKLESADAEAVGVRALLARAQLELAGGRLDAAGSVLARAEAAGGTQAAAVRVAELEARLAEAAGDPTAALHAREQAVAAAREQSDAWLLVDALAELGRSRLARGEAREAVPPLVEAVALSGRVAGLDNAQTAWLQTILAEAQLELGQVEAAYDALIQARDAFVIALGPDHPQTLATVETVGRLFVAAGRPGDAQFAFLDLLEVYTELYGVKHWRTAKIKLELADSLMAMDQHESAQALYTEALTPLAQEFGAVHPAVIRASIHLGIAELALGNLEAAQLHCSRGRDLANALPPGDPLVDEAKNCLAEIAARQSKTKPKSKPKPKR